jgi:hypothetical protein
VGRIESLVHYRSWQAVASLIYNFDSQLNGIANIEFAITIQV